MDIPESYANRRLMEKIIKPAVTEIQELDRSFKNFKCEPLYLHKRGKPLAGYKFTWEPEGGGNQKNIEQKDNKSNTDKKSQNGFANFKQRTYDYDQLEKELLNPSESDKSQSDNEFIESQMKNMFDKTRK